MRSEHKECQLIQCICDQLKPTAIHKNFTANIDYLGLTRRELTCLHHLIRGKTAAEIANALFISKRTVEIHVVRIKTKLQCSTRSQLIERAVALGLMCFEF